MTIEEIIERAETLASYVSHHGWHVNDFPFDDAKGIVRDLLVWANSDWAVDLQDAT